jgi:YfiH family protein
MRRKKTEGLEWLEFDLFQSFKEVVHGSFLRSPDIANKGKIKQALGLSNLVFVKQEHKIGCQYLKKGKRLAYISQEQSGESSKILSEVFANECNSVVSIDKASGSFEKDTMTDCLEFSSFSDKWVLGPGDILVTQEKGVGLAIHHADCQAGILYDPVTKSIGALHAGWRGQVQGIYAQAVRQMKSLFGTKAEDLWVGVSPSLGPKYSEFINYQLEWPREFWNFRIRENYFDLWEITKWQLGTIGVKERQISIASLCTYEDPNSFFSYRRDRKADVQHVTIIGLQNV